MKSKLFCIVILFTTALACSAATPNRAVNIEVSTDGRGIDPKAIEKIRNFSGNALIRGTIDNFVVNVPKFGGPIFREGGLSACAERGFSATAAEFSGYVKQLKSVRPKLGTFVRVTATKACIVKDTTPAMCGGFAAIKCPSNQQVCVDDPRDECDPNNGGADCSGICLSPK